jgi:hypothetical protein
MGQAPFQVIYIYIVYMKNLNCVLRYPYRMTRKLYRMRFSSKQMLYSLYILYMYVECDNEVDNRVWT